jgi:hypothetical protein
VKKHRSIVVALVLLCLAAFAAAQDLPRVSVRGDSVFREQRGQTDFTGNARLSVDGVMVEADRIVMQGRDVRFEGNVRLTLPRGAVVSEVKMMPPLIPIPARNQP